MNTHERLPQKKTDNTKQAHGAAGNGWRRSLKLKLSHLHLFPTAPLFSITAHPTKHTQTSSIINPLPKP